MVIDEHVMRRPVPALRGVVDFYSGYRQRDVPPAVHRGLPSPYLTVIFTLDEPLVVSEFSAGPQSYESLVGGLHTEPAYVRHDGAQSGVQLRVDPLWARSLFGLPAGELASCSVTAETVLGGFAERVHERLRSAASWAERFAVLDAAVLEQLRRHDAQPPSAEVRHAWRRLLGSAGRVGVRALSEDVGWSDRHLARQLRAETGLTPKTAGRVIRFDHARRALQRGPGSIAELAAAHGYYDQSHLVRDFTQFSGVPPSRWLATEGVPAPVPIEEN